MEAFLLQLFIFLSASAIAVPVSKRLGLGSVLGYLMAGVIIGPFGLRLIPDVESVMHFTEFGVVMMLFLVGLDLKPSLLFEMKVPILGMGGAQVLISSLLITLIGMIFLPWQEALAVGLILSLSSTAIIVQTLKEKGLMDTPPGRNVFSILLFQDLAVIPMIAFLPLLATHQIDHSDSHSEAVLFDVSELAGYWQLLFIIGAIIFIFILGRYLARPIFRVIARTNIREIFVAAALVLIVGVSLLMTIVGLSPALGAFLAGVVLADNEYRHEIESDLEPFKGLLLGIFFISIGASLNFITIGEKIWIILGITFGLILLKFIVLKLIGYSFRMTSKEKPLLALSLAQGGEFAFVLFSTTLANGVLPETVTEPLIAAVAISMFLTPLLFILYERIYEKIEAKSPEEEKRLHDTDIPGRKVILAGYGQMGTDIGRFLLSAGIKPVILDHNSTNVDLLRKYGYEVYYGDITRLDLLEAAGAAEADLLIVSISNDESTKKLVELTKKHYPNLKTLLSTKEWDTLYELYSEGAHNVRRESFGTALRIGQDAMEMLGMDPYQAYRLMRIFRKHNDQMINFFRNANIESREEHMSEYRRQMDILESMMRYDLDFDEQEIDEAWTSITPDEYNKQK